METNTFDDARQATEDMFDGQVMLGDEGGEPQQQEPEQDVQQGQMEEQPQKQEETAQEQPENQLEDAANVAQTAAQVAAEQEQQLQQIMAENQRLKQANSELQNTITQQSQQQQEHIIENALEMPTLDFNRLVFEDKDTAQQLQQEYMNKMQEYVKKNVLKDIEPAISYAKEGMQQKEKAELINALKEVPELNGIEGMLPQIENIIAANKMFSSNDIPLDEKYLAAYAIARGVESMNTPPATDPTAEELMQYYEKNPEFQQLLEQKRLEDIKSSQQVPLMSASSGAANAALNIPEKPKTWDDASERTRAMFGMK